MGGLGILFLPSGPGLNSAPAKLYLEKTFKVSKKTVFWNEPSTLRGDRVSSDDGKLWDEIGASLVRATETFSGSFVIVTESFGSILAEVLFARLKPDMQARVAGILHSPPVLDLFLAFRKILELGLDDFKSLGDTERVAQITTLIREVEVDPRIETASLHRGVALAFESPSLMPRYFRTLDTLGRWASGLGAPEFAPDPEMRDRVLRGMGERGAATRTTFAPDVPTWVCGGGSDPYQPIDAFEAAIRAANRNSRRHPIEWRPFPEASHYPHVDAYARWESSVWVPFWNAVGGR